MNLEKILGSGLLQDGPFRTLIKQHFTDATDLDLYGASVKITLDGKVTEVSCKGRTVRINGEKKE